MGLPDADEALAKADLAIEIANTIAAHGWTQEQAAEVLGIDQPRVSRIVCGHLDNYTIDSLLRFLARLNRNVTIVVDSAESDHYGSIKVRAG